MYPRGMIDTILTYEMTKFVMKASQNMRDLLNSRSWLWPSNPLLQVRISVLVSLWDPLSIFLMSFSLIASYCWSSFTLALDCVRSSSLFLSFPLRTSFLLIITFSCFFNSFFLIARCGWSSFTLTFDSVWSSSLLFSSPLKISFSLLIALSYFNSSLSFLAMHIVSI